MEKLLKLLNEYQTQRESKFKFSGYDERNLSFLLVDSDEVLWEETIISKKFWFIEWLVNNDKVIHIGEVIESIMYYGNWQIEDINCYDEYNSLLMLLSIQDDPIDFLIFILK